MRTIKLIIAYEGTKFAGWQVQPRQRTVQQTLENALEKITGQRIRVLASGRTDAGVHALGQVVGFSTDCKLPLGELHRALNANLPPDVAVLDAAEAPEGFHPISRARRKRYRYVIHDGPVRDVFQRHYAWHYRRGRLDAEAMRRASAALLGNHDFSSFETAGAERATSVRTVYDIRIQRGAKGTVPFFDRDGSQPQKPELAEKGDSPQAEGGVEQGRAGNKLPSPFGRGAGGEGGVEQGRAGEEKFFPPSDDFIVIEVEADGFLYNMARAIVGTLVEVGCGRRSESWPGEVLLAADRRAAGPTAPPQGLFLVKVEYE